MCWIISKDSDRQLGNFFLTSLYSNILEHDIIWNENTVTIITFLEIGQLLKLGLARRHLDYKYAKFN